MRRGGTVVVIALGLALGCGKHGEKAARRDAAAKPPADAAPVAVTADAAVAPPRPVPVKLAVAEHASCALMSDATVRCWGENESGQLGDGTTMPSAVPVQPKLRGVVDLAASRAFVCALLDDGSVACWGALAVGAQHGGGQPIAMPGVTKGKRLFAIDGAACAAIADGSLVCWGDIDDRGRITETGAHRVPTAVLGVDHVVALAGRAALRDGGDVVTWVAGAPKDAGIDDGREVASAGELACVLRGDARVWCAAPACAPKSAKPARPAPKPPGRPRHPGHGRPVRKPPAPVPARPEPAKPPLDALALDPALHLAFDYGPGCVITAAHAIQCLDPATCKAAATPVTGVVSISGPCAVTPRSGVRCWAKPGDRPVAIAGVTGVVQLSARGSQGCALEHEHVVTCWQGVGPASQVAFP